MTADNRTNEPNQNETKSGQAFCFTEAQVKAATLAYRGHDSYVGYAVIVCRECDEHFEDRAGFEVHLMRAALVAAQGTAPQAEMPGRQELGQTIRNKFNEARGRSGVDPWALADLILEEHPSLAAPVLPSSTVDEDALALVFAQSFPGWANKPTDYPTEQMSREVNESCIKQGREFARAAVERRAEWLKEQGR